MKKSFVKRPLPAYNSYINARRNELMSLTGLCVNDLNDLAKEEWSLITEDDKRPWLEAARAEKSSFELKKNEIEEIGVDNFMMTIHEARKNKETKEEFKEDDVLSILNHKKKWKTTWTRKKREVARVNKNFNNNVLQSKKVMKLKLN